MVVHIAAGLRISNNIYYIINMNTHNIYKEIYVILWRVNNQFKVNKYIVLFVNIKVVKFNPVAVKMTLLLYVS